MRFRPVTRCVCYDLTFAELKAIAGEERIGLEALKDRTGCCTGCGSCEPYVRLMLKTGETAFPVLDRATVERIMAEPAPE